MFVLSVVFLFLLIDVQYVFLIALMQILPYLAHDEILSILLSVF